MVKCRPCLNLNLSTPLGRVYRGEGELKIEFEKVVGENFVCQKACETLMGYPTASKN